MRPSDEPVSGFGSVTGPGSIILLALRSLRPAADRCWAAGLKVSLGVRFAKPECDRRRLRSLVRSLAVGPLAGQRLDREADGWLGAGKRLRVLASDVASWRIRRHSAVDASNAPR